MQIICLKCGKLQTHSDGEIWTIDDGNHFCGAVCRDLYREEKATSSAPIPLRAFFESLRTSPADPDQPDVVK